VADGTLDVAQLFEPIVSAMEIALPLIPQQLELELVTDPAE
jgi:hypothetical protein